jgi:hypothetical protein
MMQFWSSGDGTGSRVENKLRLEERELENIEH